MVPVKRFCIFCGNAPTNKNKEHVLPQWLITLTGDPKRVVNFGMSHNTGKIPRFDWSSFVFPSCRTCNDRYSDLENQAKSLLLRLIVHDSLSAKDYVLLLDWLDKVRIGLWLGYSYLHDNPTKIPPSFHINSRIGQKDRMVAIYTFDTVEKGLNTFGADTLCFQFQPSCFLLKINNVCLLNMSWDFMCAARCGFPFPRRTFINDDAALECSDYIVSHKVKHPVIRRHFIKPAIHLYQPIIQAPFTIGDFPNDIWLRNKMIAGSATKGTIYRQFDDRVEALSNLDTLIEKEEVEGRHRQSLRQIIAQTFDLQLESSRIHTYRASDKEKITLSRMRNKYLQQEANIYKNAFLKSLKVRL